MTIENERLRQIQMQQVLAAESAVINGISPELRKMFDAMPGPSPVEQVEVIDMKLAAAKAKNAQLKADLEKANTEIALLRSRLEAALAKAKG